MKKQLQLSCALVCASFIPTVSLLPALSQDAARNDMQYHFAAHTPSGVYAASRQSGSMWQVVFYSPLRGAFAPYTPSRFLYNGVEGTNFLQSADTEIRALTVHKDLPLVAYRRHEGEKTSGIICLENTEKGDSDGPQYKELTTRGASAFGTLITGRSGALVDDIPALVSLPVVQSLIDDPQNATEQATAFNTVVVGISSEGRVGVTLCAPEILQKHDKPAAQKKLAQMHDSILFFDESFVAFTPDCLIKNLTSLVWDNKSQRLYATFSVYSGSALLLARPTVNKEGRVTLSWSPVTFATDFDSSDYGFGKKNQTITLSALTPLHLSTGKSYLVAVRDIGSNNDKLTVTAFPVVAPRVTHVEGYVDRTYNENTVGKIRAYGSDEAAENSAGLTLSDDVKAVGGGNAPGPVNALFTIGDSVYVSCSGDTPLSRGLFFSTALCDASGEITRWSSWVPVMRTNKKFLFGGYSEGVKVFSALSTPDEESSQFSRFVRTGWIGTGTLSYIQEKLRTAYSSLTGGVTVLLPTEDTHSALSDITVLWACGKTGVSCFKTSSDGVAVSRATDDSYAHLTHPVGQVWGAFFSEEGYFYLTGENGVAVLADASGSGVALGRSTNFSSYFSDFAFRLLEGIPNDIAALSGSDGFIALATRSEIVRFEERTAYFRATNPSVPTLTVIARAQDILKSQNHAFLSLTIDNKRVFIATTGGVYYSGHALSELSPAEGGDTSSLWIELQYALSEDEGGGSRGFGLISSFSIIKSAQKDLGSNIFLIGADISTGVSSLYRLNSTADEVTLISRSENNRSFIDYGVFGSYLDNPFIDGSFLVSTSEQRGSDYTATIAFWPFSASMTSDQITKRSLVVFDVAGRSTGVLGQPVREAFSGAIVIPGGEELVIARQ